MEFKIKYPVALPRQSVSCRWLQAVEELGIFPDSLYFAEKLG
jgi:hypothetical protein